MSADQAPDAYELRKSGLAVAALVGLGSLLVWSATRQRMLDADLDPQAFLKRHLVNAVIGLTLASVATLVD